jgi:hypothetical protein
MAHRGTQWHDGLHMLVVVVVVSAHPPDGAGLSWAYEDDDTMTETAEGA